MEIFLNYYLPITVVGLFFALGILGSFLPILPGCLAIWLGVFLHKLWVPEYSVSWKFFWIITVLAVFCQVMDWVLTYWGARRFGATWKGGVGAIAGLFIAPFLFTPLIGLVIGPIVGAIVGELIGGSSIRKASKAGFGAIVGGLLAFVLKLGAALFMVVGFFINLSI